MPEDMWRDVFLDTCSSCNPLELKVHGPMGEGSVVVGDEDRHLGRHWPEGIVILPRSEIPPGHYQSDVAGFVGLEVHVDDDAPLVEDKISPFHHPNLTDAESPFVEHHDDRTVTAPHTSIDHRSDLISGEEV